MAEVTVEVTRTRVVRERLTVTVDTDLWANTYDEAFDPNTVVGWKVADYVNANDATPTVTSTDTDEDIWDNLAVTSFNADEVGNVAALRYAYCRAHIEHEEAEQALSRIRRDERFAIAMVSDLSEWLDARASDLAVAETLAVNAS